MKSNKEKVFDRSKALISRSGFMLRKKDKNGCIDIYDKTVKNPQNTRKYEIECGEKTDRIKIDDNSIFYGLNMDRYIIINKNGTKSRSVNIKVNKNIELFYEESYENVPKSYRTKYNLSPSEKSILKIKINLDNMHSYSIIFNTDSRASMDTIDISYKAFYGTFESLFTSTNDSITYFRQIISKNIEDNNHVIVSYDSESSSYTGPIYPSTKHNYRNKKDNTPFNIIKEDIIERSTLPIFVKFADSDEYMKNYKEAIRIIEPVLDDIITEFLAKKTLKDTKKYTPKRRTKVLKKIR